MTSVISGDEGGGGASEEWKIPVKSGLDRTHMSPTGPYDDAETIPVEQGEPTAADRSRNRTAAQQTVSRSFGATESGSLAIHCVLSIRESGH